MTMSGRKRLRVVVAGGGIAAAEGVLAAADLGGERVQITLLSPGPDLLLRPWRVAEAFTGTPAPRCGLDAIATAAGAEWTPDLLKWVEPAGRVVHTQAGRALRYDALLLALGARLRPAYPHAMTIDDAILPAQVHELMAQIEAGALRRLVLVAPPASAWPLPIYELALMLAEHARETGNALALTVATPEDLPLAVFGRRASTAVAQLLAERGVAVVAGEQCGVPDTGVVTLHPSRRTLVADRVVAMPQLYGPSAPGVPGRARDGFIPVDPYCRVRRLSGVYAAGDATDFPVKHGGIAAQQAHVAAAGIAAAAGAPLEVRPLRPRIEGVLLGGGHPLHLSAQLMGGRGTASLARPGPPVDPVEKTDVPYLAPLLHTNSAPGMRS